MCMCRNALKNDKFQSLNGISKMETAISSANNKKRNIIEEIKTIDIYSNLKRTPRFWNFFHHVHSLTF